MNSMGVIVEFPTTIDLNLIMDQKMTVNLALNPIMAVVGREVARDEELAEEVYDCLVFLLEVTRKRYRLAAILAACHTLISVVSANILAKIPSSGYRIVEREDGIRCVTLSSS